MDWITTEIGIGNYVDGSDAALIGANGIKSILCLDGNLPKAEGSSVPRHIVNLKDAPGNQMESFLKAVAMLERLATGSPPVLVHCHAGRSRSVVVVAGFLMRTTGCSPEEALRKVAAKRECGITPGVEQLLYYL